MRFCAVVVEDIGTQGNPDRAANVAEDIRALLAEPAEIAFGVTYGPHLQPLGCCDDPHSANILKPEPALGTGRRGPPPSVTSGDFSRRDRVKVSCERVGHGWDIPAI